MENYIVSARKYRPATFDTVVGQTALTTTLKNAISSNKLAHAYLFCGPRGVGKTTCARIFAKTINCTNPTDSGEACDKCESCVSFNEQRSYNIHELDAASNNSVDDIRLLVEQVRIQPQVGRYKVYIIDEVHMLSTSAFNAFLKTLEEPPKHAIFILATTEKHKILPTILSRCQIYDFSRITVEDIVNHLSAVAKKEGVTAEQEALNVIALKADGGMRDALSIFDQVVSYTGGNVTYSGVIENLNVLDYEYYFKLVDSLVENKTGNALLIFNDILNKGFDGGHFITGLSTHLRDLLVSKDEATTILLEVGASIREKYIAQAKNCSTKFLYRALKLCNDCDINYKASKNKRLLVELTLIQASQITEENGEEGSGLCPTKKLKPVFSKHKELSVTQEPSTDVVKEVQRQAYHTTQLVSNVVNVPKQEVTTSNSLTDKPEENKTNSIPKYTSSRFSTSIKQMMQAVSSENKPAEVNNLVSQKNEQQPMNEPFEEKDVAYYWLDYAKHLTKEEAAFSKRMEIAETSLMQDGVQFEVVLENELVLNEFMRKKADIELYIRNKIKNTNLTVSFRVRKAEERANILSGREQFEDMLKRSEAIKQLTEELGLRMF